MWFSNFRICNSLVHVYSLKYSVFKLFYLDAVHIHCLGGRRYHYGTEAILLRTWTWSNCYSHTWYSVRLPYLAVSNNVLRIVSSSGSSLVFSFTLPALHESRNRYSFLVSIVYIFYLSIFSCFVNWAETFEK